MSGPGRADRLPDTGIRCRARGPHAAEPRVRPINEAQAGCAHDGVRNRLADRLDRAVVHAGPVALPGGRIEHDGAIIGRPSCGRSAREPQPWAADDNGRSVRVVAADASQQLDRVGVRDVGEVVGLELPRRRRVLRAFAVPDEDVHGPGKAQYPEIEGVVIGVEHHAHLLPLQHPVELGGPDGEGHGQRGLAPHHAIGRRVGRDDRDRVGRLQRLEHPIPALQLVQPRRGVCEVDGDGRDGRRRPGDLTGQGTPAHTGENDAGGRRQGAHAGPFEPDAVSSSGSGSMGSVRSGRVAAIRSRQRSTSARNRSTCDTERSPR